MGREIKRVALDFDFPLGETWRGYLNPHLEELRLCPTCGGDGCSLGYRLLRALWYEHLHTEAWMLRRNDFPADLAAFAASVLDRAAVLARTHHHRGGWCYNLDQCDVDALVAAERLWDFTRVALTEEQREIVRAKMAAGGNSWLPMSNGYSPTAAEVNEWSRTGMGHDAINANVCIKARCAMYGVDPGCPAGCDDGSIPDPELSARIEAWRPTEPPAGEGWQLWQTVSEGGPISPVFATPEQLAVWITTPGPEWGREKMGYDAALRWVTGPGWAPSMVVVGGHVLTGVEAGAVCNS